ncbi:MAG: DUF1573 domain-containing protein [Bacteroidia bacterium]|jgi:hypothetical protein
MKKAIITALIAVSALSAFAQTPAGEIATQTDKKKKQAEISFDKEIHDFGVIPQGTPASFTFTFKNTGKSPLIVTSASASCGCTTPEWTKEPIKKGGKGFVKATYNAASVGPFTKQITVRTNDPKKETLNLTIKGEVKAPEYINPEILEKKKNP